MSRHTHGDAKTGPVALPSLISQFCGRSPRAFSETNRRCVSRQAAGARPGRAPNELGEPFGTADVFEAIHPFRADCVRKSLSRPGP